MISWQFRNKCIVQFSCRRYHFRSTLTKCIEYRWTDLEMAFSCPWICIREGRKSWSPTDHRPTETVCALFRNLQISKSLNFEIVLLWNRLIWNRLILKLLYRNFLTRGIFHACNLILTWTRRKNVRCEQFVWARGLCSDFVIVCSRDSSNLSLFSTSFLVHGYN